jgi:DUF971 family protein
MTLIVLTPKELAPHGNHEMRIVWNDGKEQILSFQQLRKACPCATCQEMREKFQEPTPLDKNFQLRIIPQNAPPADPQLVRVDWVGNYALRLVWDDGHDTGIYNFDYVRELGTDYKNGL